MDKTQASWMQATKVPLSQQQRRGQWDREKSVRTLALTAGYVDIEVSRYSSGQFKKKITIRNV